MRARSFCSSARISSPVQVAVHAAENVVVDVLDGDVEILDDLVLVCDEVDEFVVDDLGVEVVQADPADAVDLPDVMHGGRPLYFGDKSGPIEEIGRVVTTGPGWAYLRIAEGCDNWCAFCAIPAIRGSLLALSIKPQVLTMATSHPSTSPTTSWPA